MGAVQNVQYGGLSMSDNISFESILGKLEETVKILEEGNITLEESIALYEQGVRLSEQCRQRLNLAKQKIEIIKNENFEESDIVSDVIMEN